MTDESLSADAQPLTDRLRGMIWGQFLGDAASLGSHWIYNLTDLEQKFPGGVHGFETPGEGHYHAGKSSGQFTHYGDAALILLESIAEAGELDPAHFGEQFLSRMTPGNYAGYVDAATRGTFENFLNHRESGTGKFDYQRGADDDQLATASSLAPAVARYFGSPELPAMVEVATRVRQNNARAVAYMQVHARLLEELVLGRDFHTAFHRVEADAVQHPEFGTEFRRKFSAAIENKHRSVEEATLTLGQSCPLISSFPSALVAVLKESENPKSSLLGIIRSGGDNAGRAAMAGAWLGAHLGESGLPPDWIDRLQTRDRIASAIDRLLTARQA